MFFQFFFLQGRKSKPVQITGTIIIFKPKLTMQYCVPYSTKFQDASKKKIWG